MRRRRRRRRFALGVAIGLGIVLAIVALLVASPRHRHFYSGLFAGPPGSAPAPAAPSPPPAPMAAPEPRTPPPAVSDRPPGFVTPIVPEPSAQRTAPPPAAADRSEETPRSKEARQKQAVAVAPRGGPGDRVVVRILDEIAARLPLQGPPPYWELKEFAGRAQVDVVRDDGRVAFRLSSERTSFALYRDVTLDVKEFPLLTWSWKVTKLPTGGDIRDRSSDDQAAQVYVIFPRWPFPRINSDVLGYIWDTQAPVGTQLTSPQSSNVKLTVLESGAARLGQWVPEERNVYQDYVNLFGKEPPQVGKVAIMIDSNDTRSQAEAFVGELTFHRAPLRTGRGPGPKGLALGIPLNR
ncbi:MAG: DUF3047 domain-containing protein [Candidatus Rokubacteria bacterium]|nr:DUF3047 domain-containing protein [Candidatus Rokubacteria bacterium]